MLCGLILHIQYLPIYFSPLNIYDIIVKFWFFPFSYIISVLSGFCFFFYFTCKPWLISFSAESYPLYVKTDVDVIVCALKHSVSAFSRSSHLALVLVH